MQQDNTTAWQFADDLVFKSCKVAEFNHAEIVNNFFIDGIDAYILQSLYRYWERSPKEF